MPLSKTSPKIKEIVIGEPKPATGGHGPTKEPPTGGGGDGGGDNWSNEPPGHRGPRERLGAFRLFLFLLLIGDVFFFIVLSLIYFLRKGSHYDTHLHAAVNDWVPVHIPEILWFNTVLLLLSSVSMEAARRRLFREPYITEEWLGLRGAGRKRTLLWLIVTIVLGSGFLAGQYVAWLQLWAQRVFLRSGPASQFFY